MRSSTWTATFLLLFAIFIREFDAKWNETRRPWTQLIHVKEEVNMGLYRPVETLGIRDCELQGNMNNIAVVAMCYSNSATVNDALLLDTFRAKEATNTNPCTCMATTTAATNITFSAFKNLQPGYTNCGNQVIITSGSYYANLNCYVFADTLRLQPGTGATFQLTKPTYTWDERFCIHIRSDNSQAQVTLTCTGDSLTATTTSSTTTTTSTTTTSTTTQAPTTTTTTTQAPTTTTTTTTSSTAATTTTSSTTQQPITTSTTAATQTQSSNQVTTGSQLPSNPLTTTPTPSGGITDASKEDDSGIRSLPWQVIVPAVGAGLIILIVIIISCIMYSKRKVSKPYETAMIESGKTAPYNSMNAGLDPGEEMTEKSIHSENPMYNSAEAFHKESKENQVNGINNSAYIDDVKIKSTSGDQTSGTFVRCSVVPPDVDQSTPVYAEVDKSSKIVKEEKSTRDENVLY